MPITLQPSAKRDIPIAEGTGVERISLKIYETILPIVVTGVGDKYRIFCFLSGKWSSF